MKFGNELTNDERNLLCIAYKNVVGSRRIAWRALASLEGKEETKVIIKNSNILIQGSSHIEELKEYKKAIEIEIESIVTEVLKILDTDLTPSAKTLDAKVFYLKMKGDYYRYWCECLLGEK